MASLNSSPILGVSARDIPRYYQNSTNSADARLTDICNTITLTIEPTNRPGAVKTSSGYPARRCSVTREDIIELTTRFLAAAKAGLAKGYNALEMNEVQSYGYAKRRIPLALAYNAVLQAQQRALAGRLVPSAWSTNEAQDAMEALADLAIAMDFQGLGFARGVHQPTYPLPPRPAPSERPPPPTVGADPISLGVGAISTIALAFILLGPFIGAAATVAILRGDPSKRERPSKTKPKSISRPSPAELPEPDEP